MRYAVPLLANRISPRCTIAEGILVIEVQNLEVVRQVIVPLAGRSWSELLGMLVSERIDTLVCGGIARNARRELETRNISVVDNVSATAVAVVEAIGNGSLRSGFGFVPTGNRPAPGAREPVRMSGVPGPGIDCLSCRRPVCKEGKACPHLGSRQIVAPTPTEARILEATRDIASEPTDRTLCRLSELVYFGLETGVQRLGVAFCWDLVEPTRILVSVLRRFFDVIPVGCRFGIDQESGPTAGLSGSDDDNEDQGCDPLTQAAVLTEAGTDLNVLVGLCLGADCAFTAVSRVPVTTLFVKDRSLANNPIGALYSEYYLQEALRTANEVKT